MEEIKELLNKIIKELFGINFDAEITPAPEGIEADYSSNAAMKLAKELHKSPMEIAQEIEAELEKQKLFLGTIPQAAAEEEAARPREDGRRERRVPKEAFALTISTPGFLNFILPDEYFSSKITDLSTNFDKNISCSEYSGKTVVCEFSDPNPFKVLHVGHLYTSIVGDSISRLFEYAGAKVVRANFGGDVGLHVAKTLYSLLEKQKSLLGTIPQAAAEEEAARPREDGRRERRVPKETFCFSVEDIASCYVAGTKAYEEDENAKKQITELNKKIYTINKNNEHGNVLADLYWQGRELSYEYFKDFYAKLGVKFDKFYPESTVADLGMAKVTEQLEKGIYEMSDGAVIFDGDKFGLHTRVFINKKGVPTYETKDVGLIFQKWADWHFDKSVIITGNEQLDYMKVVLKSIEQYAPDLVEKTAHLTHGLVKMPGNVKISSRLGNGLKAVDVLDMVTDELKNSYNSEDIKVVMAATKYAFLKYKMGGNIIFDPKESVKMTGNSGPYLLYSCVRAKKVLEKIEDKKNTLSGHGVLAARLHGGEPPLPRQQAAEWSREEYSSLSLDFAERSLIKKILEYKDVLGGAVREMAPHKVAGYLYELAQEFSRFYENCPVAGSEFEKERGQLVALYLQTMTHGLNILGIEIPEEM